MGTNHHYIITAYFEWLMAIVAIVTPHDHSTKSMMSMGRYLFVTRFMGSLQHDWNIIAIGNAIINRQFLHNCTTIKGEYRSTCHGKCHTQRITFQLRDRQFQVGVGKWVSGYFSALSPPSDHDDDDSDDRPVQCQWVKWSPVNHWAIVNIYVIVSWYLPFPPPPSVQIYL